MAYPVARSAVWLLTALTTLSFCSCRSMPGACDTSCVASARPAPPAQQAQEAPLPAGETYAQQTAPAQPMAPQPYPIPVGPAISHHIVQAAHNAPTLPDSAYTGNPYDQHPGPSGYPGSCQSCGCGNQMGACGGGPGSPCGGSWSPPGIGCPWPADEYICDGGDRDTNVNVMQDWTVRGLELEDTVAHYDTLKGETIVEPSNRVCIYAPRFAAIRTVKGLNEAQQNQNPLAARDREIVHQDRDTLLAATSTQQVQPLGKFGLKPVNIYESRDTGILIRRNLIPAGLTDQLLPHEDFKIMQAGQFDLAEKARLAAAVEAAITWTDNVAVQVVIDGSLPIEASNNVAVEQVYKYDLQGKPRIRIIKTASKQNAKPGEIVDFTLRFDNIGDETIGNVTIIDNLTTRLEFVPGSVQSSVEAEFFTQENQGDSLALRWEVVDPLKVGQGGIIRFQAKVR